jgi:hypothetical protein
VRTALPSRSKSRTRGEEKSKQAGSGRGKMTRADFPLLGRRPSRELADHTSGQSPAGRAAGGTLMMPRLGAVVGLYANSSLVSPGPQAVTSVLRSRTRRWTGKAVQGYSPYMEQVGQSGRLSPSQLVCPAHALALAQRTSLRRTCFYLHPKK